MARVVIEHLTKVFPGPKGERICALEEAGLTVESGELLALVGPSGCGKTTTLRLVAGLDEPTSGTISIDGRAMNGVPPKDREIAMVFQNPALYPHMTVYENMAFGLRLRRCSEAEIEKRVREAAEILGLDGCLDRLPMALSGGQRQRAAVGRALVRRPKVFLLDEPLSSLDAPLRAQMRAEISRLHARLGSTMIYVTHDQAEAMMLGERVAVMKTGSIQQVADPLELYHQPANLFVAGFIGAPPMNFFNGALVQRDDALFFEEEACPGAAAATRVILRVEKGMAAALAPCRGKDVILGVRPENITGRLLAPEASPQWTVEAVVEFVESLGAETYLHLAGAGRSFVARFTPEESVKPQQKTSLTFDMRWAHFFDPATGKAIG